MHLRVNLSLIGLCGRDDKSYRPGRARRILLLLFDIVGKKIYWFVRRIHKEENLEQEQAVTVQESRDVSFGEWFLTIFLAAIPLVNIVLFFVWAFSASTKPSKANWAKATLVWAVLAILFYVIIFVVVLGTGVFFAGGQ
jgi:hypothetical protein